MRIGGWPGRDWRSHAPGRAVGDRRSSEELAGVCEPAGVLHPAVQESTAPDPGVTDSASPAPCSPVGLSRTVFSY